MLWLASCVWIDDAWLADHRDRDGDGVLAWDDCDDEDGGVRGTSERYVDQDGDGVGSGDPFPGCPDEGVATGTDCDDTDPDVLGSTLRYADVDGDGHRTSTGEASCDPTDQRSAEPGDDCDDTDPDVHPGVREDCRDGVDQDCSGVPDDCVIEGRAIFGRCEGDEYPPRCDKGTVAKYDQSGIAMVGPAFADLDGDARPELITAVPWVRAVFAFDLGSGEDLYLSDSLWTFPTDINNPYTVATADFASAGSPDLLVGDADSARGEVGVLWDLGVGEPLDFDASVVDDAPNSRFSYALVVADLGRGRESLVIGAPLAEGGCGAVYLLDGGFDGWAEPVSELLDAGLATSLTMPCETDEDAVDGLGTVVEPVELGSGTALALGFPGEDRDNGGVWLWWDTDATGVVRVDEGPAGHWTGSYETTAGAAMASGDFDGDGEADLAVSAIYDGDNQGLVYLLLGLDERIAAGDVTGELSREADGWVRGEMAAGYSSAFFGGSIEAVDIDGDGRHELAVGAPGMDGEDAGDHAGAVYLFADLGAGGMEAADAVAYRTGQAWSYLGWSLTAGNLDDDAGEELVVGAPQWDTVGALLVVDDAGW